MANSRQRLSVRQNFCLKLPSALEFTSVVGGWGPVSGRRRGRRRLNRRVRWIDPARQNAAIQRVGDLRIDVVSMLDQATERRLDVGARATETVVEIKVTGGGVEVV